MSSRYRHDGTPLLDGDLDHQIFDSVSYGSSQHAQQPLAGLPDARLSSPPGLNQAEAKRDRRRQQVREAQARFRDRKDRTAEELRARTVVLSDALEKARSENRMLRARLSRYERVDLPVDEAGDGASGGLPGTSMHTSSWPGTSNAQKPPERSPGGYRGPQLSGPQHIGWDQPGQSLLSEEPLSLSAPAHMDMTSDTSPQQQRLSSSYGGPTRPGMIPSQQQPASRDRTMYAGLDLNTEGTGKGRKVEDSPVHLSAPGPSMRAFPAASPDHARFQPKGAMTQHSVWPPVAGFDYPFHDSGAPQQAQHGMWRGGPMGGAATAAASAQSFGTSAGSMQLQSPHEARIGQSPHMQGRRQQSEVVTGHPQYQGGSTKSGFPQARDDRMQASLDTVSRWHSAMPPTQMLDNQPWSATPQLSHQQPSHQDNRMQGGVPGPAHGHMTEGE